MANTLCHKRVSFYELSKENPLNAGFSTSGTKLAQAARESYKVFLKETQQIQEEREKHLEERRRIREMLDSTIERLEKQEKNLEKFLLHLQSVHGRG